MSTHGPIESEYEQKMVKIAHTLDLIFNGRVGGPGRETGFVLLIFKFDEADGRMNYISNGGNRKHIAELFREQIKNFERHEAEKTNGRDSN